jgi:hypothetical protein
MPRILTGRKRYAVAMSSKSLRDIRRVLAGETPYDDLDERGQAIVRASWNEQAAERLARLDLAAEFTQAGRSWTEADEQGSAVVRSSNNSDAAS